MKTVRFTILIVLAVLAAVPLTASAQGPITYTTGFQVANLDMAQDATVVIEYYDQDGRLNTTFNDVIPKGENRTYYPIHPAEGFNGSVVVSSDRQIAAIVNILGDGGDFGGASYSGFTRGANTSYIPLVLRNYYGIYTWFNVQNTSSTAAEVTVTYAGSPTPTCTESATIPPWAAHTFRQKDSSCLRDGFIGAATVTANQEIAVTVVEYDSKSLLSYDGFTTLGSVDPTMPLVSHGYYNSRTGIQIQNTGSQNTDVTVTYTPSRGFPGQQCSETKTIPAGQSVNFGDIALFERPDQPCGPMSGPAGTVGFVGSARVTRNSNNQTLVAIVNSVNRGKPDAAAYSGFDTAQATAHLNMPLIMDRNYGIFTGISIANVGTQPTTVRCTFSGTTYTVEQLVQPGEGLTDVQLNKIRDRYVGTANCTATGGDAKIVGVVSQLGGRGDKLLIYEAINY